MGTNLHKSKSSGLDSPAEFGAAITPHNSNELAYYTRGIYVGSTGDVKVTTVGGSTITFVGVPTGVILPVRAKIVFATGTTATSLVALW